MAHGRGHMAQVGHRSSVTDRRLPIAYGLVQHLGCKGGVTDGMARLLIVDDEARILELISKYAEFSGHLVCTASNGMEAVRCAENEKFDIVIMDIMMPELDGFSAVQRIRAFSDVPVMLLSARGEEYDKIHGFELGIDDYVTKPFSPKEMMMRVDAILKRSGKIADTTKREVWNREGLVADITARSVSVDGKQVSMSPKEYDLFFYLLKNRNIALSREKLITDVWGYDFLGEDRTLDTHIKLLRKSLGPYAKYIVTLRSLGYRFEG